MSFRRQALLFLFLVAPIVSGCRDPAAAPVASVHGTGDASGGLHERETGRILNQHPVMRGAIPHRSPTMSGGLASPVAQAPAPQATATTPATLVLYDDGDQWGWLGELYAAAAGTLASHFGTWSAKPVRSYLAGDMNAFSAVIYIGSTFDQPLPAAFLQDTLTGARPVLWIDDNIWQLADYSATFGTDYGFVPYIYDTTSISAVSYQGASLARYAAQGAGVMTYSALDATKASVLATAVRADGTTFPWAVRSKNLTYLGENPFVYITANDRYLVFCDLLFDLLAPGTTPRHRALVRLEDVDPSADPTALRAFADYLASENVPFSIATIPVYTDPRGYYNGGVAERITMRQSTAVAQAIQYMLGKGGTLVMHGYTHQYSNVQNPYSGVSADDFEFFRAHIDANNSVVYDGPVAGDTAAWAGGRISSGLRELASARLPVPTIFELPHYAGSDIDVRTVALSFKTVYHRETYYGGILLGGTPNYTHYVSLFLPYVATDAYGLKVIPENLGNYEPTAFNNNPARLATDIVYSARVNQAVVRDGVASFFFHPYYDIAQLKTIVSGLKTMGYTFVAPGSL